MTVDDDDPTTRVGYRFVLAAAHLRQAHSEVHGTDEERFHLMYAVQAALDEVRDILEMDPE